MQSNREISRLFKLYAELLKVHGKDIPLAEALSTAAYRVTNLDMEVEFMNDKEVAATFPKMVIPVIHELKNTRDIAAVDELVELTPQGIFEIMRIKGLGGTKIRELWYALDIDSIDALLDACKKGEVSKLRGFGAKTVKNIINEIDTYHGNETRFHYASVADAANKLVKALQQLLGSKLISLCGEARRQATTVEAIEIITDVQAVKFNNDGLKKLLIVQSTNKELTKAFTHDEIPVTIYHVPKTEFYDELFRRTGNEEHVRKVLEKATISGKAPSETAIYRRAKLPYIIPEMREDVAEWNFKGKEKDLIKVSDITGVVHNHTTWSDGVDDLAKFARTCKYRQFEYTVISDHSKNAHYAGGLKEEEVLQQMQEIDELNKQMKPFKIFKSIECDIRVSGELDYEDSFLKLFDLVIISVHQQLKMDEQKATARLIRAIENPYTTILGHMTGRQLLIRPGYPLNFKKVIDTCAANKVVIEMNANPYRLDMDWSHIPYALDKGVMISINPDAHSTKEIDNIKWGVSAARKGGLTKSMTWNAMPLQKIEAWLTSKKRGR